MCGAHQSGVVLPYDVARQRKEFFFSYFSIYFFLSPNEFVVAPFEKEMRKTIVYIDGKKE
jgi:hypothetical protein